MSILIAVVDAGSLSAAARKLGMPLATVSRKLAELEAHLTTRLLHDAVQDAKEALHGDGARALFRPAGEAKTLDDGADEAPAESAPAPELQREQNG